MFEIPDDDDNFWEDLPLNDISNENVTLVKNSESEIQKNQPHSFNQNNSNKKRCVSIHDQPSKNQGRQFPNNDVASGQSSLSLERDPDGGWNDSRNNCFQGKLIDSLRGPCLNIPPQPSRVLVPFTQEVVLTRDPLLNSPRTPSWNTSVSDTDVRNENSTLHSNNGRLSNKRKRKFPGPAGLLPRLGQGHTLDSPDISKVKDDAVSPEQGIEKTDLILSSQSGEEVFNERPWQTLMTDLQDDGQNTLQRFSLASSLQKAKKKQLPRGKVLFVMAVIETLEWPGKDASVTLKDKSGTIQGTVHESLMKEYECDLQPGSVLVLRQVSVISPTSRNHYLNITPANVVCVYSNKSEGLSRLHFVDKDKPLPTILKNLEREMVAELTPQMPRTNTPQSRSNMGTPDIRNLQSRFSTGTPVIGTPQVRFNMGTPNIRTPQSRFNTGTPHIRTPHVRLNMGTPDIRTAQSRLNVGTPDLGNPHPRFNVGHGGKTSVEPSKLYPIGERTSGVGLSGVQGTPVSRTGSNTPHSKPGQSSRNTGANVMEVGVTRQPVGSSTPHTGSNFSTPRFSMPDREHTNSSSIVHQIHMPSNGNISYNSGSVTPSTSQGGTTPINRTQQGRAAPGNGTGQGGSEPGNKTPNGAIISGRRGASLNHSTPVVDNLQSQNPGHPIARSKSPSDIQKSEISSAVLSSTNTPKFLNWEKTSSNGVCRLPLSSVNNLVTNTGQCTVSSSGSCPSTVSIYPSHNVNSGPVISHLSNNGKYSGRADTTCTNWNNSTPSANTSNRKGFKFKSTKSLTSPDNSLALPVGQKSNNFPAGGSTITGSVPNVPNSPRKPAMGVESLWQDDLSDDILSQLSEELV